MSKEYAYVLEDLSITAMSHFPMPPRLSFPGWCPVARITIDNPDPEIYNTEVGQPILTDNRVYTLTEAAVLKPLPDLQTVLLKRLSEVVQTQYSEFHIGEFLYIEKARQARQFVQYPEASYPLLEASVGIDGETLRDVAKIVIANADLADAAQAAIERVRLMTKSKIQKATTSEEAFQFWNEFLQIDWHGQLEPYYTAKAIVYNTDGSLRQYTE